MSTHDLTCEICLETKQSAGKRVLFEDDNWLIRHSRETDILGYVVLQSKRHFLDLSEAHTKEYESLGNILAATVRAIKETVHAERVYTITLTEKVPHFHVHLIPRTYGLPKIYRGRGILAYPVDKKADPVQVEEVSSRLTSKLKRAYLQAQAN